ncbi:MAG: hypothetical protein E7174_02180 [Firmicutes bacterium]|nr:hypothetical protein [Bacillota bacterium]
MKKGTIIILTIITLVLTFIFAEIFSIYHFGSLPTLLTSLYLISIFAILEYLAISITYIVKRVIKKEKLEIKKIIGLVLLFVALLLVLLYLVVLDVDYLHSYMNSAPFYLNVIVRSVEFLIPSIILIVIGILLIKNKKKK